MSSNSLASVQRQRRTESAGLFGLGALLSVQFELSLRPPPADSVQLELAHIKSSAEPGHSAAASKE